MTFVLALDASSRTYAVAVGRGDQPPAERATRRGDPGWAEIGELAAQALADVGASFGDIAAIGVDIGPGGLSSIRAAVAYANGLAFSLGVQIFAISSLELMAIAARQRLSEPVLSVKRGQGGNVYAALFVDGADTEMRYGLPEAIVPALADGLDKVSVAGVTRDDVVGFLPGVTVLETEVADANVTVLYEETKKAVAQPARMISTATALNEGSRVFHEPSSHRSQRP